MEERLRRGSATTLVALVLLVALDLYGALLVLPEEGLLGPGSTRALLVVGLAIALWRGYTWARWILVALASISAGISVVYLVSFPPVPIVVGMTAVYAAVAVTLAASLDVTAFVRSQRNRRVGLSTEAVHSGGYGGTMTDSLHHSDKNSQQGTTERNSR